MYVAFQCSSLFLLPSSTPSASRRILQKVRLPPLVSSRPSSFRYSSRILPPLFSCRHMSKFLRRSCFRIEGFLREEDVNWRRSFEAVDIAENLGIKMLFIIDNVDNHIWTNWRKIVKCQSSSLPQKYWYQKFSSNWFSSQKNEKKVCFWCQETIMQILQRPNRTEGALMKCFKDSFWTIVSTKKQNNVSFVVGHPNMLHSFHTYNYISPLY